MREGDSFKKSKLGKIDIRHSMGAVATLDTLAEIPVSRLKGELSRIGLANARTRLDCIIDRSVLEEMEDILDTYQEGTAQVMWRGTDLELNINDFVLFNNIKAAGGVQRYLENNFMLTITESEDGEPQVLPYGLYMGASLANLSVGNIAERAHKGEAGRQDIDDVLELKAYSINLVTNAEDLDGILEKLRAALEKSGNNLLEFLSIVQTIRIAPIDIEEIKEIFEASSEVWRSL